MSIASLSPRFSPAGGAYQDLVFLCPRCRGHYIEVAIWNGPHGDHRVPLNGMPGMVATKRLWHAEQDEHRTLDSLTITPSIDRTGLDRCGGWHGFVTNGEVTTC